MNIFDCIRYTLSGTLMIIQEGDIKDEYKQFGFYDEDDDGEFNENFDDDDEDDDFDDDDDFGDDDDDDENFREVFEFRHFDGKKELEGKIIQIPKVVSRLRGGIKRPYDLFINGNIIAENIPCT